MVRGVSDLGEDLGKVKERIRRHIMSVAPGMMLALDMYSMKECGRRFLDLCVTDKERAARIVRKVSGDEVMARILIEVLINKPLGGGPEKL